MKRGVPMRVWTICTLGLAASLILLIVFDRDVSGGIVPSAPTTQLEPITNSVQESAAIYVAATTERHAPSSPRSVEQSQPGAPTGSRKGAAKPLYLFPSDPLELSKRFFGEAAAEIQNKWQHESRSPDAERVEGAIYDVYTNAEASEGVRAIECRATLCRLQLDKPFATTNPAATQRMAGKLGPNGWLMRGSTHDELLAFVPIDFEPM